MTSLERVRAIAVATRADLLRAGESTRNLCDIASAILCERLRAAGFVASVMSGSFEVERPDPANIGPLDELPVKIDLSELEIEYGHEWTRVLVDGMAYVVDLTADQFDSEMRHRSPSVLLVPEALARHHVFGRYKEASLISASLRSAREMGLLA